MAQKSNLVPDVMIAQHFFLWNLALEASKLLTEFNLNQPTRVALIVEDNSLVPGMYVYDPYQLIDSHKQQLKPYFANAEWKNPRSPQPNIHQISHFNDYHGQLPIAAHWFIEEPYTRIIASLSKSWASVFSDSVYGQLPIFNGRKTPYYFRQSMSMFSTIAVQNCLSDLAGDNSQSYSKDFVELMKAIESMKEEGEAPEGKILLTANANTFQGIVFREPKEVTPKQCIKLLTAVRQSEYALLIDKIGIRGLADISQFSGKGISAKFTDLSCSLSILGDLDNIAAIKQQKLFRAEGQPYLQAISQKLEFLFGIKCTDAEGVIEQIVEKARQSSFGCTVAIFNPTANVLMGNYFDSAKKLTDVYALLPGMAHVDGAVHVNPAGEILGFGVLLDGVSAPALENSSKGARHNSAIRFTHQNDKSIVLVVSEDGPITIFVAGIATKQTLPLKDPDAIGPAPKIADWLR